MTRPMPFKKVLEFEYGVLERVTPSVRRIVARNPSPFTWHGTGTYVIGKDRVAVVDPGPDLSEHVDALLGALEGETVTHMLVTHTHRDHSPACRALQVATGAPSYAYGSHGSGRIEAGVQVEEGADYDFSPDIVVRHGDVIQGDGWSVECVYTPGHTSNHMCYQLRETRELFCGDHVMGWSTTIISPPDGDLGTYLDSLALLLDRDDRRYWPTHGPCVDDPHELVRALIDHRLERVEEVHACLADGIHDIPAMVARMYADIPAFMHRAAGRSVLSTLLYMMARGEAACEGEPAMSARFTLPG